MSAILERIKSGELPDHAREALVKGLVPLEPEELLEALPLLCVTADLLSAAEATVEALPEGVKKSFFQNKLINPDLIDFYLCNIRLTTDVKMVMVLNPNTRGETLAAVAHALEAQLLDLVVNNQVKILEAPSICDALRQNPGLSINQRQKIDEYQRLLFKSKISSAEELENKSIEEIEAEAIEDAKNFVQVFGRETGGLSKRGAVVDTQDTDDEDRLEEDPDLADPSKTPGSSNKKEKISVLEQLAGMTVPQKIQAAIKGDREVRNILVRDSNKLVSCAVIKSPRITDAEVEFYANLRNVQTDILRLIAQNREWTKNYKVIHNLVKNPRTPVSFTVKFLPRLNKKDLKGLEKDKGVPEVIRVMARKMSKGIPE